MKKQNSININMEKNLPLEATKNSKKNKRTNQELKKKTYLTPKFNHHSWAYSWSKNLQKLEDRKATSTWFWRTQLNSLTSGTTAIV